jgi:hypothetical protein
MSQAVISMEESIQEEELVLAKMFEEILSEKLDEIFKQRLISLSVPFNEEYDSRLFSKIDV